MHFVDMMVGNTTVGALLPRHLGYGQPPWTISLNTSDVVWEMCGAVLPSVLPSLLAVCNTTAAAVEHCGPWAFDFMACPSVQAYIVGEIAKRGLPLFFERAIQMSLPAHLIPLPAHFFEMRWCGPLPSGISEGLFQTMCGAVERVWGRCAPQMDWLVCPQVARMVQQAARNVFRH